MDNRHRRQRAVQISLLSLGLSVALQAAAQQAPDGSSSDAEQTRDAKTLDAVRVTGERTTSYTVEQTAAATRLALTPQDTPQSLTVVTQQRIEDQNLQSVRDVLDNVTGVFSSAYDTERVVFYARGFQVENMSYDGVPIASSLNSSSADASLDTAIYDRIEILRGATGLLSGAGSPSASINFIRKHANAREFSGDFSLSVGSWNTYRGTADLSAPLNSDGSVRGRFVAAYEQGDSYLDRYSNEKKVAYGVIDADLGAATTLSVGYDYQETNPESVTWGSYPVFYDDGGFITWPRSFNTSTDWTYWNNKTQTAFVDLNHRFGNGWQLRALASHRRTDADQALFYVYGFPNRETGEGLDPYAYLGRDAGRQDNLDVYASGPFQLGGREHELVVGATGSRYKKTTDEHAHDDLAAVGNFLQWNGSYPRPVFAGQADRVTDIRTDQSGLYAAARLSLADPLKLIVGARYSRWKNDTDDVYSGVFRHEHNETVPYAGLIYAIDPTWSVFASYTEIFNPQDERTATGSFLDPVVGASYEIGIKGRHLDGRLNSSLVLFDTKQDNVAEADVGNYLPDGMTQAYFAVDGTRSRGAEFELAGDLTENWNASLGWSYFDLEGPDGEKLRTALPRTLFRLFTTYRLPGAWNGLTIGGGANWQSASHALVDGPNGPQRVNQSSVTLLSLMARYQFSPQAELQLNADNLLDRKYFVLDEYSNLYYAAPSNATLSFRYRF
ncbi:MAG TPA: ferric-rhodotorulic acid/ferric-coprogen receptor FhuE [Stenotrophomonas sp.]